MTSKGSVLAVELLHVTNKGSVLAVLDWCTRPAKVQIRLCWIGAQDQQRFSFSCVGLVHMTSKGSVLAVFDRCI